MKKYKTFFTEKARSDIKSNEEYIRCTLKNNNAAEMFANNVIRAIASLKNVPHRYALIDLGERTNLGIRAMVLQKYKIFYYIDEDKSKVEILRLLHSHQNEFRELLSDDNMYPKYVHEDKAKYDCNDEAKYDCDDNEHDSGHAVGGIVTKSSADLRSNYSMISALLNDENMHVIITRNSKKEAVLISVEEFERLNG